ncbi:MAG: undecaprenyl/decaprenyl-phosphate alpha-N-acetylglucosaminyl 1-phosphate transferase [Clostridia bacterium]|nr:undecaprenyl/decaprenyl-phosphate alpha-N-acetylglucosaminyl 1-phosphate transferase [Clostridia bacterium]
MQILWLCRALCLSGLLSLALTPFDFRIAAALGAIDIPRDGRRMHTRPIPRLGGLSIFFSFLLLSIFYDFKIASDLFYIWSGAILIVLVGVLDDELSLPPLIKFFVQGAAAYVATMGDGVFHTLSFGETSLSLGALALPITLLFTVTMTNAHNFIDGLDGLCAGVSLCESLGLGLLCLATSPEYAVAAVLLGGACLGFLPYNLRGAQLFMGDTGSTLLGFVLAAIAVRTLDRPLTLLLLFALPLADLVFAVVRRLLRGKNPLYSDRSHLHHLLADRVGAYSASKRLTFAAALTAILAVLIN